MLILVALVATLFHYGAAARVYLLDEDTLRNERFLSRAMPPSTRLKRQTHPAATIAKLPTPDNNPFIPIAGPTQTLSGQSSSLFHNAESFQNTLEFPANGGRGDTPIDYLVPPNPDSHITSLNFQDPAANLQHIDNVFDVTSPTSSSSNNFASFQSFPPNSFPPGASASLTQLHNQQPPNPPPQNVAQISLTTDHVPSISFQSPPLSPSPPPSPIQNPVAAPPPPLSNQFLNKISHPNKDPPAANQFPASPSQFAGKPEATQSDRSSGAKWDLGFDANDILAPPREDSFGGGGGARNREYDTINVPKFRRLNHAASGGPSPHSSSPSVINHQVPPTINHFAAPNQFPTPNLVGQPSPQQHHQHPQFNQFAGNNFANAPGEQFASSNGHFTPASNQLAGSNQFVKDDTVNNPNNIVWGTQKQQQQLNFAGPGVATTNPPFLPTVPPTQPTNVNFQSAVAPLPAFNPAQAQLHQQPQQLQSQPPFQPPSNGNQLLYHHLQNVNLNQNFALETPLTSQFDTFLPQGTVSDHTFPQHFRKRQVSSDEDREVDEPDDEPVSKYKRKPGPVYSFVKTDRDGHFKWSVRHPSRR